MQVFGSSGFQIHNSMLFGCSSLNYYYHQDDFFYLSQGTSHVHSLRKREHPKNRHSKPCGLQSGEANAN